MTGGGVTPPRAGTSDRPVAAAAQLGVGGLEQAVTLFDACVGPLA
jgi:hypothetical protein